MIENRTERTHITNLSFLTAYTGKPYLYVFNHHNGAQNIEAFISLRNPYDIQHVIGQMAERNGRLMECKVEAGGVCVCGEVWLTEA